ncbi:MAG: hypothetical protein H7068_06395 [Pedobacter sp.]|nr:hypothetical protein [Chitinophagaceae bacterium]
MTILSKFKITFLLFICVFSFISNAQESKSNNEILSCYSKNYYNFNFKGKVKSVKTRYVSIKEALTKTVKQNVKVKNDVRNNNYLEFYENGLLKIQYGNIPLFEFDVIDSTKNEIMQYDSKDIAKKRKYKPILNIVNIFQVPELFVNFDLYIYSYELGPTINGVEHLGRIQTNYIYKTDKNNRIIESFKYLPYNENRDTVRIKNIKKEDLLWNIKYLYNKKNQIISQKIIPGDKALGKEDGFGVTYTALGTESGFYSDLQLKYKYDNKGRVIQSIFWGNNRVISSEDYEYHPSKGFVQKVRCYVSGAGEIANPTKKYIKTHNENGDIIEKEFILDFPEQKISPMKRFYDYEYDKYNNWIKCNMYLEGTKEGEPTLVAEREIEYYN